MSSISEKYRKDYKNADFGNPRLVQKKEKRQRRWRQLAWWSGFLLAAAAMYVLFFSNFFEIKHLELRGLQRIKSANIEKIATDYMAGKGGYVFSQGNFFVFNKRQLIKEIGKFYSLESCQIKKIWPNRVLIELAERTAKLNWYTQELCFHLDDSGTAIEYCTDEYNGQEFNFKIKDLTERKLAVGEQAVAREELTGLIQLHKELSQLGFVGIELLAKNGSIVDVKTSQGPTFKFNLRLNISEQILRLNMLLQGSALKNDWQNKQYFDLRFGQKIYYK